MQGRFVLYHSPLRLSPVPVVLYFLSTKQIKAILRNKHGRSGADSVTKCWQIGLLFLRVLHLHCFGHFHRCLWWTMIRAGWSWFHHNVCMPLSSQKEKKESAYRPTRYFSITSGETIQRFTCLSSFNILVTVQIFFSLLWLFYFLFFSASLTGHRMLCGDCRSWWEINIQ